jgi:hypothetical protein
MKLTLPFPFSIFAFRDWVAGTKPIRIDLADREYALLTALLGKNVKEFDGIPIAFADAPRVV